MELLHNVLAFVIVIVVTKIERFGRNLALCCIGLGNIVGFIGLLGTAQNRLLASSEFWNRLYTFRGRKTSSIRIVFVLLSDFLFLDLPNRLYIMYLYCFQSKSIWLFSICGDKNWNKNLLYYVSHVLLI